MTGGTVKAPSVADTHSKLSPTDTNSLPTQRLRTGQTLAGTHTESLIHRFAAQPAHTGAVHTLVKMHCQAHFQAH